MENAVTQYRKPDIGNFLRVSRIPVGLCLTFEG